MRARSASESTQTAATHSGAGLLLPRCTLALLLRARLGGLPAGLFVNSLTAFEGVLGHFVHLPPGSFDTSVIGCYDYDPFAAYLQFPVHMIRQDSHRLIAEAYRLIETPHPGITVKEVEPELIPPRTIYAGPFGEHG
jgi:LacI family fructose operon transcriptional repressor